MVDITSLKARLARLRLGSEFDDKNPDLADPVTVERKKKKAKKASKDKEKVRGSYNRTKRQEGSTQSYKKSGFGEYTKNTGDKRKKKNKLTRSDQKRGKKAAKIRKTENEYDPSKPREGFSKKEYEGLKKIRAEQIRMKKNSSYIPKAAPQV